MTGEAAMVNNSDNNNDDKLPEKIEVRDKITRTPPVKPDKSVSNIKNQLSKSKQNESKSKQHQSRTIDKLKSSADRRSSSSQSQKRRRSKSPDENAEKVSDADSSMDDNTKSSDPDLICPVCTKKFHKDDSCVFCECCARWFHAKCQNISEREVTAFKLLKDLAHYYCPNCKAGASELHKATVDIRIRVESLEKSVESLHRDNDTTKTDVKNLQTQQKSNTTSLRTLKTVQATLKQDVDTNKTEIKTLKRNEQLHKEEVETMKAKQASNTTSINAVSTRVEAAEGILEKINSLIDDRIDEKGTKDPENRASPELLMEEPKVKDFLTKLIDERINEKAQNPSSVTNTTAYIESEEGQRVLKQQIQEKVDEHFPYLATPSMEVDQDDSNPGPKVNPTFSSAVLNVMSEQNEIQKRKLQIVITNVRETENPEEDKKDAEQIFTLMGVPVNFVEAIRVGQRKAERPRVIRVTLQNATDKRNLLAKATSLRDIPQDHKYAKVYVKPNLTHQQQITQKNLQRQLKEIRLKNPQVQYKISQNKIIEVPKNN